MIRQNGWGWQLPPDCELFGSYYARTPTNRKIKVEKILLALRAPGRYSINVVRLRNTEKKNIFGAGGNCHPL
jgi:hypothetical protein